MALRRACAYSKRYARPYTRKSKVKSKSYIKSVPTSKVVKMRMGDQHKYERGDFPIIMYLVTRGQLQIRDNALEASRQFLNRFLVEKFTNDFYLELRVYPHHVLRENKMLTGAGADRMQTGMALSFGATVGRAAFLKKNQIIYCVGVSNDKAEKYARELLTSVKARLPGSIAIETVKKPVKKAEA